MNADDLVHKAVELAVERNPRLALEPYYQMKQAARILADVLINSPVVGMEPWCSCENPHGGYRCLNCYLPRNRGECNPNVVLDATRMCMPGDEPLA
jgi:hypothetical protein